MDELRNVLGISRLSNPTGSWDGGLSSPSHLAVRVVPVTLRCTSHNYSGRLATHANGLTSDILARLALTKNSQRPARV